MDKTNANNTPSTSSTRRRRPFGVSQNSNLNRNAPLATAAMQRALNSNRGCDEAIEEEDIGAVVAEGVSICADFVE
ncbi:UNVERIFIED_CONTAM: hypothetical protein HDU68_011924 [Siphonaria sp. JEL0065]|nr:hypothetical protein HDU68_011924 [Siphonaria sp. JEL0065]